MFLMSKPVRLFCFLLLAAQIFSVPVSSDADPVPRAYRPPITAAISMESRPRVKISGLFWHARPLDRQKTFSLTTRVAGVDVGDRISDLTLTDSAGKSIRFRKLGPGEYLAEQEIVGWSYSVDLKVPAESQKTAHVSWLTDRLGILMLNDLLPTFGPNGVQAWILVSPTGSKVFGLPRLEDYRPGDFLGGRYDADMYVSSTSDKGLLLVGEGWRNHHINSGLDLTISGTWHFQDAEAADMAQQVYAEYRKVFGSGPSAFTSFIGLANFPMPTKPGEWYGETRGNNVTIISSDMPFRTQSLQRLHEQLRHELFHLWIPNGVNLTGNYDWFYEGFALYQSLKLGVGVNRIRFEDFLDTLSRAHTIDSAQSQRISLIQASTTRFSGSYTQVYARGMLAAFLCDVAIMRGSNGKQSVESLLKTLYRNHGESAGDVDANTAVLALMRSNPSLIPIVDKYIVGSDKIDWTAELESAGIEDSDGGILTALRVKQKLSGKQKTLLDKLGYNNWRKLSPTSK
jgi:hypothetical protein